MHLHISKVRRVAKSEISGLSDKPLRGCLAECPTAPRLKRETIA